jgi:hypothetical protein
MPLVNSWATPTTTGTADWYKNPTSPTGNTWDSYTGATQPTTTQNWGSPTSSFMADPTPTPTMTMRSDPTPVMMDTFQPTQTMTMAPNPMPSMMENPMPVQDMTMGSGPSAQTMQNYPAASYSQGPGFNTQYGTLENIQPYMNPFLDQIIARGNHAIESSAAARGGLMSSGTLNNIGDWTQKATENAYGQARSAFNNDRQYMTDQYWNTDAANRKDYWDNENHQWDIYKYGNDDFQNRLNDYYSQSQGIVNTGYNASHLAGGLTQDQASALASLGLSRAQIAALASSTQGQNNGGLVDGLFNTIMQLFGQGG